MLKSILYTFNGLTSNLSKYKVIIFGIRSAVNSIDYYQFCLSPVTVDGTSMQFVRKVRNRAVLLTSDLSWNRQVSHISHNVFELLHKLEHHSHILSLDFKEKLVI